MTGKKGVKMTGARFAAATAARMAAADTRRAGSNAEANARATAALLDTFSEGKNVASAQKALRLSGTRARKLMAPLKADLAEIVSQGQSPRYAAMLLGWPARAGVVVWEAICRDVGEPVLP